MKMRKKSPFALGIVLVTALILAACGDGDSGEATSNGNGGGDPELEPIVYSAFDGLNGMAVRFGHEKGFFEEEGIDLEIIAADDEVAVLTSGDVDLADASTTRAMVGAGKGAPIKMIASMYRTQGPFYLIASPEIESVEDLRGKDVGVGIAGSGMDVYVRYILEEHGVDPSEVNLINNGVYQQGYSTLETGQVDATMIHEPFVTMGEETGNAHLLALGWEYLPEFHTGALAASDRFIESNPEAIERFLEGYLKSQEYAKENQQEYIDYVTERMDIEPDMLKAALDREEVLWENDMLLDVERIAETQRIQLELGFQDEEYDIEDMVDTQFYSEE